MNILEFENRIVWANKRLSNEISEEQRDILRVIFTGDNLRESTIKEILYSKGSTSEKIEDIKRIYKEPEKKDWLLTKLEKNSDRYMEAEMFICDIVELTWYQRTFSLNKRILDFLKSREKYNL